jgi:prepilin-type processing-associated H-X9-DG protein
VLILPQLERGPLSASWNLVDPWKNVLVNPVENPAPPRSATILDVLICPSDILPTKIAVDNSGNQFGLTSYGGNGGVQSYRPASATRDGIFYQSYVGTQKASNPYVLRMADILDGASNTLLFGERYHRDVNYDLNAGTYTKMTGWGYWCPSTGDPGMGDVTLGTMVPINYLHPPGVAVNNAYEDRRITALGSGHPGGCNVALADGATRFVSDSVDNTTWRALSTRAGGETIGSY